MSTPSVGRIVHYVSYGTPGGEYASQCRAAVITEVGQWVTVEEVRRKSYDKSEGRAIRTLEQWYYSDAVALAVLNPTGAFFNGAAGMACKHDPGREPSPTLGMKPMCDGKAHEGGTWHWPERVE